MLQLFRLFQENEYAIHFVSSAEKSIYSDDLEALGIHTSSIQLNTDSVDDSIKEFHPTHVLFDRFTSEEKFAWQIREIFPDAITILDTEDLHFLRYARQEAVKAGIEFNSKMLYTDLAKREIASILRCDLSLIISEVEMKLLIEEFQIPVYILMYLPFLLDNIPEIKLDFEERTNFLFIGNFLHEPNIDAVGVLKKEVWPKIRKQLPKAELHIYGAYMPEKIKQLHQSGENFLIKGRAEEVGEIMQASRVFLAPLRFGAGQKGKLLEAMCYSLPSITTSLGAESMHGNIPWAGFISDDWQKFADQAVDLYQSEQKWSNAVEQCGKILKDRFTKTKFQSLFLKQLEDIENNKRDHRNTNFIGQILQTNQLNAYKYMSRWIAEKNKK